MFEQHLPRLYETDRGHFIDLNHLVSVSPLRKCERNAVISWHYVLFLTDKESNHVCEGYSSEKSAEASRAAIIKAWAGERDEEALDV